MDGEKILKKLFVARTKLTWRDDIVFAPSLCPSEKYSPEDIRDMRMRREAWGNYFAHAFSTGHLALEGKNDLKGRLASPKSDNFRGGLAECFASWFLARLGGKILPTSKARPGKNLEFAVTLGSSTFNVEVKSPENENRAVDGAIDPDVDKELIEGCLKAANKQFGKTSQNLLVLVPWLATSIYTHRYPYFRAFFGDGTMSVPIQGPGGPPKTTFGFSPRGKWIKQVPDKLGEPPKPRFTRVSAALVIEENIRNGAVVWDAIMMQNPRALHPIDQSLFSSMPQWIRKDGGSMGWSDGRSYLR